MKKHPNIKLRAKSWLTEAPLRMLLNNLHPDVAEHPEQLIVYGGIGKAARNKECLDKIIESLEKLNDDETLLIQSGKPVAILKTQIDAPRVLIANSNLVPKWSTWDHFHELDKKGLMMFGQMTAGSWIYIGSQGIIQGTYETFMEVGSRHYGGDLSGKWILTGGLGGMGGAQSLAGSLAGASVMVVECDETRIDKRLRQNYLDHKCYSLDEALSIIKKSCDEKKPVSVGLLGNCSEVLPLIVEKNIVPDILTDQTSAHDPLNGYLPSGWSTEMAEKLRKTDPDRVISFSKKFDG